MDLISPPPLAQFGLLHFDRSDKRAVTARGASICVTVAYLTQQGVEPIPAVIKDGIAHVQAGGGIVYDSDPDFEFEETEHKARALIRAIEQASGNSPPGWSGNRSRIRRSCDALTCADAKRECAGRDMARNDGIGNPRKPAVPQMDVGATDLCACSAKERGARRQRTGTARTVCGAKSAWRPAGNPLAL